MSRSATAATLDTSIWVPYLRARRYARVVEPLIAAGRVWIHSVVLLELYAGASRREDKRAIDRLRLEARNLGRLFHPSEDDLSLAGQILAYHGARYGRVRPRDHSHDLLIGIGAGRTGSLLLTENLRDMTRWSDLLRQRAGIRVAVALPPR